MNFNMDDRLTLACKAGDVNALYDLIEEDADILRRFHMIMFVDTPLHIAACDGQSCFAMEMINLMPSFGYKLNRSGFSPMHLALMNGHSKLVLLLLRADSDLVRVKGRGGMTPFHLACTKHGNHVDLLANFLVACPKSIEDLTAQGETALHVAVKSNNLDALEVLVGWLHRVCHEDAFNWERNIPNWKDNHGHTILDIAAASNNMQLEVLRLLAEINAKTSEGLTVLDILQMRQIYMGGNRELKILSSTNSPKQNDSTVVTSYLRSKPSYDEMLAVYITRHKMKTSDDMRNLLLVVAGFITASTLQILLHMDTGDHQQDDSEATPPIPSSTFISAGKAPRALIFLFASLIYNDLAFCIVTGVIGLLLPDGLFGMILILLLPDSILCYIYCIQHRSPHGLAKYSLLAFFLAYIVVFFVWITYSRGQNKLRQLEINNTNKFASIYRKRKTEALDRSQATSAIRHDEDLEM